MNYIDAYEVCLKKLKLHMKKMNTKLIELVDSDNGKYYENYKEHDFATYRWDWLSSMTTGMASIAYQTIGDKDALKWAYRFKDEYHNKVFAPYTQTMHDIGFLYLPYSVHLYMLTGDTQHRDTALKAADELAKRFNIKGRFIEAWDEMKLPQRECRMIIDSSMNVALLYWAWKETGHCFYRDVADAHLDTIIKTLVRDDYSVAHAWFFDSETGKPKEEINSCGYSNGSHWARGTAWVVYGLAMAYSYTANTRYLDYAVKIGEKYLECLEDNYVPVWDFRLPKDKPAAGGANITQNFDFFWDETKAENKIYNVDTSAAAIMSCAFMLICSYEENKSFADYTDNVLNELCNKYLNTDETVEGILAGSNGRYRYATYGDYYFMLALAMKNYSINTCWGVMGSDSRIVI